MLIKECKGGQSRSRAKRYSSEIPVQSIKYKHAVPLYYMKCMKMCVCIVEVNVKATYLQQYMFDFLSG